MSVFTGKKLKEARIAAGLSQDDASKKMNMSRRSLGYIEAGEREATANQIVDFAKLSNGDLRAEFSANCFRRFLRSDCAVGAAAA